MSCTPGPLSEDRILVTGASGYIGGRLVPRLLAAGYRVRCLVRSPEKLANRPWSDDPRVEIFAGDLRDRQSTLRAMRGCTVAYYLVHSMLAAGQSYAEADSQIARRFAEVAESAGLWRIIYLGGLGETGHGLSEHLNSRREVEVELGLGKVPVTVLRAAMIIGSGSASFEILRYLVERLPLMVTPRWVQTRCQPIGVADVLHYLLACLQNPRTIGRTIDIGGPEVITYLDIIQLTAKLRGLPRRLIIPVPILTPRLSSLWIHLVTPISARIARPLAEGLRNEVICRNDHAAELIPHRAMSLPECIQAAMDEEHEDSVETRWSDAGVVPGDPDWAGGKVFTDPRQIGIDATPASVYRAVCRVGGGHGWYAADWLWRLRGLMDKLVGGPGLRRGRRDAAQVSYGEALDFWRVTGINPNRRLELRAEMRLPGLATLTFEVKPDPQRADRCVLEQTARFKPKGLFGLLYWYACLPLHGVVFRGMLRGIKRSAEKGMEKPSGRPLPASASGTPAKS
ncbi:MAG: SDR family oxidoreductase [Planctomycetota bacterium]|jgi:uncharacterized protein YbjT (DUF2867 family)